jgi:hypothetical protein
VQVAEESHLRAGSGEPPSLGGSLVGSGRGYSGILAILLGIFFCRRLRNCANRVVAIGGLRHDWSGSRRRRGRRRAIIASKARARIRTITSAVIGKGLPTAG